jgi:AcrB/AcrD/AcrF family
VAALDRLSQRFPPGLKYLVNYDTTTFVHATIHDVLITLVIAFALVVAVVFVFLGSLRATLIPAIAVPVSVGQRRREARAGQGSARPSATEPLLYDRHGRPAGPCGSARRRNRSIRTAGHKPDDVRPGRDLGHG